jgi:hypothetical protein
VYAKTPDEVLICQNSRLSTLDEQMSSVFFRLRNALSGSLASNEALRTEIPTRELEEENVAELAADRNWMWACARSVETNLPINIYVIRGSICGQVAV